MRNESIGESSTRRSAGLALKALAASACLVCASAAAAEEAAMPPQRPSAARSVHLRYGPQAQNPVCAEATVTVTETQTNSYFMVLGWDAGYCGLQDLGRHGKIFIFSVWEPGDPFDMQARESDVPLEERAKVLFAAPNVEVYRFDREGTGAKTMANIDWKVGEPVSVRVEYEPDGEDRAIYGCWVKTKGGDWTPVAAISTICAKPSDRGVCNIHSFIEDFWRNGWSATVSRRAEFRDIRSRSAGEDAEWVYAYAAMFTADRTPTENIDAGCTGDGAFFLKTGGSTTNEHVKLERVVKLGGR